MVCVILIGEIPEGFEITCADTQVKLVGTHIGELIIYVTNREDEEELIRLQSVVYVPELSINLMSLSRITRDDEYNVNFQKYFADIYEVQSGTTVFTAIDRNGMKFVWCRCAKS